MLRYSHTGEHIKNVMLACIDKWKIDIKFPTRVREVNIVDLTQSPPRQLAIEEATNPVKCVKCHNIIGCLTCMMQLAQHDNRCPLCKDDSIMSSCLKYPPRYCMVKPQRRFNMITCACIPMTFQLFSNAICRGKYESSASHKIFFFWFLSILFRSIQYLKLVKTKNPK